MLIGWISKFILLLWNLLPSILAEIVLFIFCLFNNLSSSIKLCNQPIILGAELNKIRKECTLFPRQWFTIPLWYNLVSFGKEMVRVSERIHIAYNLYISEMYGKTIFDNLCQLHWSCYRYAHGMEIISQTRKNDLKC